MLFAPIRLHDLNATCGSYGTQISISQETSLKDIGLILCAQYRATIYCKT